MEEKRIQLKTQFGNEYIVCLSFISCINLFLQVSGTHRYLILFLAAGITRPLCRNVVLSTSRPVLVVLKFIWNKLFSWLFNHRLRFQFFVWECACTWIKISTRWCKWKRCKNIDNFFFVINKTLLSIKSLVFFFFAVIRFFGSWIILLVLFVFLVGPERGFEYCKDDQTSKYAT